MRQFLARHNHLYGQLLLLLALNVLSGFILYGKPLTEGKLYWDMLDLFSFFRDNLNSLNYFGEVAWWNPNLSFGLPMYYLSILGHSLYNPFFAFLAATCWLLGLLNIHIKSFLTLYSIYIVFIIPFFFSAGSLLVGRQIFRSNRTITVLLLLISFSPGIVLNLGDEGLLVTGWSLFFAAAFLRFFRAPSQSRFWALCTAAAVNALAFNHIALHWSVLFVPLFCAVCLFVSDIPLRQLADKARSAVPRWSWILAGSAMIICLLPTFVTYLQGGDLVRTKTSTRWYPMEYLRAGNPLETLTISTPAIGFDWYNNTVWRPFSYFGKPPHAYNMDYLAYTYMGLLSLPLAIMGLLYGRRLWRLRLLILIALSSLAVVLSAYSPLFYLIMFWEQPLRAVNHYSDMFFRLGGFFLVTLAAVLGFEVLLRGRAAIKRLFLKIFCITSTGSLLLMLWLYGRSLLDTPMFGFAALMSGLFALILIGMMRREKLSRAPYLKILLIAFMAVDISTVATWHVRHFAWTAPPYEEGPADTVGLPSNDPGSRTAQGLLQVRLIKEYMDAGADLQTVPFVGTFTFEQSGRRSSLSTQNVKLLRQTYDTAMFETAADAPLNLFWRDAFFPGWKATVNGRPTEIMNVNGFKAVAVPQGRSVILFTFSPGTLPYALLLAYAVLAVLFALWLRSVRTGISKR